RTCARPHRCRIVAVLVGHDAPSFALTTETVRCPTCLGQVDGVDGWTERSASRCHAATTGPPPPLDLGHRSGLLAPAPCRTPAADPCARCSWSAESFRFPPGWTRPRRRGEGAGD